MTPLERDPHPPINETGDEDEMDLVSAAIALCTVIFTVIVGGWFANRVHKLEDRVDELEAQQHEDWKYIRALLDFIYRNGLTPPSRENTP